MTIRFREATALAWLLAHGPDVVPIPGTRRPERVDELVPRAGWSGDRRSFAVPVTARATGYGPDSAAPR